VDKSSPIPTTSLLTKWLFVVEESENEEEEVIRNVPG